MDIDEQLRTEGPVTNTVADLIGILSEKIDGVARYGIYADDARQEGCQGCVDLFQRLDQQDRQLVGELIGHLQQHLQQGNVLRERRAA